MINKIAISLHPLGDILFNQKLIYKLVEHGYEIYFPLGKYRWLSEYININNVHWNKMPNEEYITINLAHSIVKNHPYDVMTSKYSSLEYLLPDCPKELFNIDYSDWFKYLKINRNKQRENSLFYDYFDLKDDSKYILANNNFGDNQVRSGVGANIQNRDLPVVWLQHLSNFTLLDWIKVIENATEIHTVDTSILYIAEILNLKAGILNVYPRDLNYPDRAAKTIIGVINKPWEYIY